MIENIFKKDELLGFYRRQSKGFEEKSVKKKYIESEVEEGWEIARENIHSTRLRRPKKRSDLLDSRVWTLMYKMGFEYLSGTGGAFISTSRGDDPRPKSQIDVVAIDDEIGVYIECKSHEKPKKDPSFPKDLARHANLRKPFADSIRRQYRSTTKRIVSSIFFTWDLILRNPDKERAKDQNIILFDEKDLEYFEALVKHLGPAARFQFLCEVAKGRQIPGLNIRVPALRAKMGEFVCYNFSIRPDYLLKIAYVAHRSKGRSIDVDAYQRMVSKSRLKKIADYITDDGMFPTNIVINIENPKYIQFDRGKQEGGDEGAKYGWLTFSPSYGAAWIIDGQHRLYAYSGHNRAASSYVNVLAFEGLAESKQAQLFVDINSEQKRVKTSLLVELNAKLRWEADEDEKRADAIASRVGLALDEDEDSPLKDRIALSDVQKTEKRCVTLTSIVSALDKPGFFIYARKKGVTEYGAFWRDDNALTFRRTKKVVKFWLRTIADSATDWWAIGAGEGGGLAMNNGITVCINVLRSVLEHLRVKYNLRLRDDEDLCGILEKYAAALGAYFAGMTAEERKSFRALQGVTGQTTGTKDCQQALHDKYPKFNPPDLDEWIRRKKENTNEQAKKIVDWIEIRLQDVILSVLHDEFGDDEDLWWFNGVPKAVRKKVDEKINDADGKLGNREQNFDIINYREIIKYNWLLFADIFGYGKRNASKDKRTDWIAFVNKIRNIVKHPSRREYVSIDELNRLKKFEEWLYSSLEEQGYDT